MKQLQLPARPSRQVGRRLDSSRIGAGWPAILVLVTSFLIAGCFEIAEEVWVNPDGSGRLKIDIGMSEALMKMGEKEGEGEQTTDLAKDFEKAKQELAKNPNVKKIDIQQYSDAGLKHYALDIEVNDVTALNDIQKAVYSEKKDTSATAEMTTPKPMENSELRIEKQSNGKILFVRKFGTASEEKKEESTDSLSKSMEEMGKAMASAMFGNASYTVKLHAENIVSSNGKIDEAKKTVEWKIPFADLLSSTQKEFRAEIAPPRNVLMWIIAAILAVGILGGILVAVRKKKSAAPTEVQNP